MTRQKFAAAGFICYAVFFAASGTQAVFCLIFASVLSAGALAVGLMKKRNAAFALFAAAVSFLVYGSYSLFFVESCGGLYGRETDITAKVERVDSLANDTMSITLSARAEGIDFGLSLITTDRNLRRGDIVSARVKLVKPDYTRSADENYNYSRGIFVRAEQISELAVTAAGSPDLISLISDFSEGIKAQIPRYLGGESEALLKALFFGDSSGLSVKQTTEIKRCGLSHMTAVSGMHLTLIAGIFTSVLSLFGLGRRPRASFFVTAGMALLFTVFFGMSVSVVRSAVMLLICAGAPLFRRKSSPLNSLGFALLVILLSKPCACRDAGLLLSVSATVGVGYAAPAVCARLKHDLSKALATGLCATLLTLPACVVCFGGVSLLSPFLTLIVYPFFIIALFCTTIFTLFCGMFGEALLLPAGAALNVFGKVTELASGLPFAYIPIDRRLFIPVALFAAPAIALALLPGGEKRFKRVLTCAAVFIGLLAALLCIRQSALSGLTKITVHSASKGCAVTIEDSAGLYAAVSGIGKGTAYAAATALTESGRSAYDLMLCVGSKKYSETSRAGVGSLCRGTFVEYSGERYYTETESGVVFSFTEDTLYAKIGGLVLSLSPAGKETYEADIAIISGYKKDAAPTGASLTVFTDRRYPEYKEPWLINSYYTDTVIYIDRDGGFYTDKR